MSGAVTLSLPPQPVAPRAALRVVVSVEAQPSGLVRGSLVLRLDPTVLALGRVAARNATVSAPSSTFASGVVPLTVSGAPGTPGLIEIAWLDFSVAGSAGDSTMLAVDALDLYFADGTAAAGVGATARVIVRPDPLDIPGALGPLGPVTLPIGSTAQFYLHRLVATGGVRPLRWTSPQMPDGLALSPDGVVSGWPQAVGTLQFEAEVADSSTSPQIYSMGFSLVVTPGPLGVPPIQLNDFIVGWDYGTPLAARGGAPPWRWSIVSGTLPTGIQLRADGVLLGRCTGIGAFNVRFAVIDAAQNRAEATATLRARTLYGEQRCGRVAGARALAALPNLVPEPYEMTIDTRVESTTGAVPASVRASLMLDGRAVWSGTLGSGDQRLSLGRVPGGPRLLQLTLDGGEPPSHRLVVRRLVITPTADHHRPHSTPLELSYAVIDPRDGSLVADGRSLAPGVSLADTIMLPGSADDLLVARTGGVELLALREDGTAVSMGAYSTPDLRRVVWASPGAARGHVLYGAPTGNDAIIALRQEPDGTWSSRRLPAGRTFSGISAADIDGDGQPEALLGTAAGVVVLKMEGGPPIGPWATQGAAGQEEVVAVAGADLDGDGRADIVAANRYGGSLAVFVGVSPSGSSAPSVVSAPGQPVALAVGHQDSTGRLMLAVACRAQNVVRTYATGPGAALVAGPVIEVGGAPADLLLADLTGGGRAAIVTADASSSTLTVALAEGSGYSQPDCYTGPARTSAVVALRGPHGEIQLVALGTAQGELLYWRSHEWHPACQVVPGWLAVSGLAGGSAWVGRSALLVGNAGGRELHFQALRLVGSQPGSFELTNPSTPPRSLLPGRALPLDIVFLGGQSDVHSCVAEVRTDDPLYPVVRIPVRVEVGATSAPVQASGTTVDFGSVNIGERPPTRTWALVNLTNSTATLRSLTILGSDADVFKVLSPSLPASLGRLLDVRLQAQTSLGGGFRALLVAEGETGGAPFTVATRLMASISAISTPSLELPTLMNFGTSAIGYPVDSGLPGWNRGPGELVISAAAISGPHANDFNVATGLPVTIPAFRNLSGVRISFLPRASGLREATLTLTTNDPAHRSATLALRGAGLAAYIDLLPTVLDFGTLSAPDERQATLYNFGSVTSRVSVPRVSGPFTVQHPSFPITLVPGFGQSVTVRANVPPAAGAVTGSIVFGTDDPARPSLKLDLAATWLVSAPPTPDLLLPEKFDLGRAVVGRSVWSSLPGKNRGPGNLIISAATLSGPHASDFDVTATLPVTIPARGDLSAIKVGFTPQARGSREAVLTLTTNDPARPSAGITLIGGGVR